MLKEVGGQPLVIRPDLSIQVGSLGTGRMAIPGDQRALPAERFQPGAIHVQGAASEKVHRAEERVSLKHIPVEIRQRFYFPIFHLLRRNDGQPEAQLAQPHRFAFEVDAEERALDDVLP